MLAEITTEEGSRSLRIRFTNDTAEPQWLARSRAVIGEEPDSGFLVVEPAAAYRGPVLKRLPYVESELLEVPAQGSSTSDPFDLADYYRVHAGDVVSVRYSAAHPLAGLAQVSGPLTRVMSPAVSIRIDAATE